MMPSSRCLKLAGESDEHRMVEALVHIGAEIAAVLLAVEPDRGLHAEALQGGQRRRAEQIVDHDDRGRGPPVAPLDCARVEAGVERGRDGLLTAGGRSPGCRKRPINFCSAAVSGRGALGRPSSPKPASTRRRPSRASANAGGSRPCSSRWSICARSNSSLALDAVPKGLLLGRVEHGRAGGRVRPPPGGAAVERKPGTVRGDGLLQPPLPLACRAEVGVRRRRARRERQRRAKRTLGCCVVPLPQRQIAEGDVQARLVGRQRRGGLERLTRLVEGAAVGGDEAADVVRAGIARVVGEDGAPDGLRLRAVARPVGGECRAGAGATLSRAVRARHGSP